MQTLLLYTTCVLIWGSTWFVITMQLGSVSPVVSVFYRFLLAAVISFIFCLVAKKKLKFTRQDHGWLFLQALGMFCINYILTYYSEAYTTSGIVAVTFTLLIYFNVFLMRLFFKTPIEGRVMVSGLIGAVGVFCLFYEEILGSSSNPSSLKGLIMAIVATFFASVGNVISVRNRNKRLPVIESNAWSMLYGGLAAGLIALAVGEKFTFLPTSRYVFSLLYLAIFGSVVAFAAYLTLIGRIGADRAAYTGILTAVVALIISSVFEKFHGQMTTYVGVFLCLLGNYMIMGRKT